MTSRRPSLTDRLRTAWRARKSRSDASRRRPRELGSYAEGIRIPDVDGRSGAILRPSGIGYDVDAELDACADQLALEAQAKGLSTSRTAATRTASFGPQADGARDLAAKAGEEYDAARAAHTQAQDDLVAFVRRRPKDSRRYQWTRIGLLGADTGAVLGALIYVGEVPVLALGTALAVGLSAVTAGMLGSDVRELKLARDRRALVEAEQIAGALPARYPRLFGTPSKDRDTYGQAMLWGLVVVISIAVGVFALRAAIEGLVGVVFAGFAMAVALASFISSWAHGDDVADLLEVYAQRVARAKAEYLLHLMAPEPSAEAAWRATTESIQAEHAAIGQAKAEGVRGLKHAVHRNNRHVFGDGTTEHRVLRTVVRPLDDHRLRDETDDLDQALVHESANHFQSNGAPPF